MKQHLPDDAEYVEVTAAEDGVYLLARVYNDDDELIAQQHAAEGPEANR